MENTEDLIASDRRNFNSDIVALVKEIIKQPIQRTIPPKNQILVDVKDQSCECNLGGISPKAKEQIHVMVDQIVGYTLLFLTNLNEYNTEVILKKFDFLQLEKMKHIVARSLSESFLLKMISMEVIPEEDINSTLQESVSNYNLQVNSDQGLDKTIRIQKQEALKVLGMKTDFKGKNELKSKIPILKNRPNCVHSSVSNYSLSKNSRQTRSSPALKRKTFSINNVPKTSNKNSNMVLTESNKIDSLKRNCSVRSLSHARSRTPKTVKLNSSKSLCNIAARNTSRNKRSIRNRSCEKNLKIESKCEQTEDSDISLLKKQSEIIDNLWQEIKKVNSNEDQKQSFDTIIESVYNLKSISKELLMNSKMPLNENNSTSSDFCSKIFSRRGFYTKTTQTNFINSADKGIIDIRGYTSKDVNVNLVLVNEGVKSVSSEDGKSCSGKISQNMNLEIDCSKASIRFKLDEQGKEENLKSSKLILQLDLHYPNDKNVKQKMLFRKVQSCEAITMKSNNEFLNDPKESDQHTKSIKRMVLPLDASRGINPSQISYTFKPAEAAINAYNAEMKPLKEAIKSLKAKIKKLNVSKSECPHCSRNVVVKTKQGRILTPPLINERDMSFVRHHSLHHFVDSYRRCFPWLFIVDGVFSPLYSVIFTKRNSVNIEEIDHDFDDNLEGVNGIEKIEHSCLPFYMTDRKNHFNDIMPNIIRIWSKRPYVPGDGGLRMPYMKYNTLDKKNKHS